MAASSLEYITVDVFASRPFAGNQLAVVLGGDELSTYQMQTIAAEFNLAETTFPVALTAEEESAGADYRVRIFTASQELPFAGHPTLGTAAVLASRGLLGAGDRVQACGAGHIGVRVPADLADSFELSARPRDLSGALAPGVAADCAQSIGLRADDVVGDAVVAGCGLSWLHLPVSEGSLGRARPWQEGMAEVDLGDYVLQDPLIGINVYAPRGATADGALSVRSRVFAPSPTLPEDPATGSAAVGLGIALVATGRADVAGVTRYEIEQGVELGRPSYLFGRVEAVAGVAQMCWVAGQVQPIGHGTITIPPA